MSPLRYEITLAGGLWRVTRVGAAKPYASFSSADDAVETVVRLELRAELADEEDGVGVTEWTYGKDPRNRRG